MKGRPPRAGQSCRIAPRSRARGLSGASRSAVLAMLAAWLGSCPRSGVCQERPPSPLPDYTPAATQAREPRGDLLVVRGADGTEEYGAMFADWTAAWVRAAQAGDLTPRVLGEAPDDPQEHQAAQEDARVKAALRQALAEAANETAHPLWIVMIGHGTFDGRSAKFNLIGEDVSDEELSAWLAPLTRPVAILQCASASGEFLPRLSRPGRVVVTATKSGGEVNFARFGGELAAAISDPAADLDKDGQVSLLEAFLRAARQTDEYYTSRNLLATEHSLIDDNGDARGTRMEAFRGIRPVREADSGDTLDGYLAHQWTLVPSAVERELSPEFRQRRDALELQVLHLRELKETLPEDDYYARLEPLLLELARLYAEAEGASAAASP